MLYSTAYVTSLLLLLPTAVLSLPTDSDTLAARQSTEQSRGGGNTCPPRGNPQQLTLTFEDIPTYPDSDFYQLGNPNNVPYEYNGFQFQQNDQWYIMRCNNFQTNTALQNYYKSCGGSAQALWTAGTTSVLHIPAPQVFDVDSFFVTPITFANIDIKVKITGKTSTGSSKGPYEIKVKGDVRTQIKGLRAKGFEALREFQVQTLKMDGSTVGYVIDDAKIRKYECGGY
ncbi:hypothetical protein P167DRAFT_604036 [Morchella conica CCBAS932]|uniref:Uncharacterized protein n=1 Tax=Morchella conica CCBAS932 TaxID=1392247 RepID=A0A3N4KVK8_9PEZI|nr:hypothetical protein P167DRAFT_604036 [Morchella conica CCBAS932]